MGVSDSIVVQEELTPLDREFLRLQGVERDIELLLLAVAAHQDLSPGARRVGAHQRRQVYKTGSKAEYKGERNPADVAKGGAYPVPIHKQARARVTNKEGGRILSDEIYTARAGGESCVIQW